MSVQTSTRHPSSPRPAPGSERRLFVSIGVMAFAEPCLLAPCMTGSGMVPGARRFVARMIVPSRSCPSNTPARPGEGIPGIAAMLCPACALPAG